NSLRRTGFRQVVEFRLDREARVEDPSAALQRVGDQLRQAMIALRTDHEIDTGRTADDLGPLRLCNATSHRHYDAATALSLRRLQATDCAKLGIHLFGCFLSNVTSIENNQIRILQVLGGKKAMQRENIHHPCRIIDVHLAAISLDEDALHESARRCLAYYCWSHPTAA